MGTERLWTLAARFGPSPLHRVNFIVERLKNKQKGGVSPVIKLHLPLIKIKRQSAGIDRSVDSAK